MSTDKDKDTDKDIEQSSGPGDEILKAIARGGGPPHSVLVGAHPRGSGGTQVQHMPHPGQEANRARMEAAMRGYKIRDDTEEGEQGGGATDMGPGQFENTQLDQQQKLMQAQTLQQAQKAQQAQGQQMPPASTQTPPGKAGVTVPYPAQKAQQRQSGGPEEASQESA